MTGHNPQPSNIKRKIGANLSFVIKIPKTIPVATAMGPLTEAQQRYLLKVSVSRVIVPPFLAAAAAKGIELTTPNDYEAMLGSATKQEETKDHVVYLAETVVVFTTHRSDSWENLTRWIPKALEGITQVQVSGVTMSPVQVS